MLSETATREDNVMLYGIGGVRKWFLTPWEGLMTSIAGRTMPYAGPAPAAPAQI